MSIATPPLKVSVSFYCLDNINTLRGALRPSYAALISPRTQLKCGFNDPQNMLSLTSSGSVCMDTHKALYHVCYTFNHRNYSKKGKKRHLQRHGGKKKNQPFQLFIVILVSLFLMGRTSGSLYYIQHGNLDLLFSAKHGARAAASLAASRSRVT